MHIYHKDGAEHFCIKYSKLIIILLFVALVLVLTHDYTKERPLAKTTDIGRFETIPVATSNKVIIVTNLGQIHIKLLPEVAPQTVQQFKTAGHYNGCQFYRFERGFVIQGGCHHNREKPALPTLPLEYDAKKPNVRGSISMARTSDPNSATSEFAIQLADNSKWLGPGGSDNYGYAVFAEVLVGQNVLEQMLDKHDENKDFRLTFQHLSFA